MKNMYMKFDGGKLLITAPNRYTTDYIEKFIKDKKSWVLKNLKLQEEIKMEKEDKIIDGGNLYFLGKKYIIHLVCSTRNQITFSEDTAHIEIKEKYFVDEQYISKFVDKWIREMCLRVTMRYTNIYAEKMKNFNVPEPKIVIKKFKSRWGCCIPKRKEINFALNLIKTDEQCIEYVVVHELAHFKYIHHDKKFYEFVSIFIPDWKKRRNMLNRKYGLLIK